MLNTDDLVQETRYSPGISCTLCIEIPRDDFPSKDISIWHFISVAVIKENKCYFVHS